VVLGHEGSSKFITERRRAMKTKTNVKAGGISVKGG
jgi:hypothetical protein